MLLESCTLIEMDCCLLVMGQGKGLGCYLEPISNCSFQTHVAPKMGSKGRQEKSKGAFPPGAHNMLLPERPMPHVMMF
jgi:hypothetical protein